MSNERSSLVHDRCTTCGSLLPCVLHDREVRRVILEQETDETWPEFEKVWEGRTDGDTFNVEQSSDGTILCSSSYEVTHVKPLEIVFQLLIREINGWRFESIKSSDDQFMRLANGSKSLYVPGVGILSVDPSGYVRLFFPSGRAGYWLERIVGEIDLNYSPKIKVVGMYSVKDLVVVQFKHLSDFQIIEGDECILQIQIPKEPGETWNIQPMLNEQGEEMSVPVSIYKFSDSELLVASSSSTVLQTPNFEGQNFHWNAEKLKHADGTALHLSQFIKFQLQLLGHSGQTERFVYFNIDVFGFGDRSRQLIILEPDPDSPGAWRRKIISSQQDFESEEAKTYVALGQLSDKSFLAFRRDGCIHRWTENSNGEWRFAVIRQADGRNISKVILDSIDPPSYILLQNSVLEYWRIPPDKWRVYHERQAKQNDIPPLPSDL